MSESVNDVERSCRERTDAARRDPRSTAELISLALSEADEDRAWECVVTLHFRATRDVLDAAAQLCESECERERSLSADILGQLGVPDRAFPEECHLLLAGMLQRETNPDVLRDICIAYGQLKHPGAVALLVALRNHPHENVRYAVAYGLEGHDDPQAVAALIELTTDPDEDVRDWATFALGKQTELDTPAIREALAARLDDPHEPTLAEAVSGLARRRDERALPFVRDILQQEGASLDFSFADVLKDATHLADPRLLPLLLACRAKDRLVAEWLAEAIRACGGAPGETG